MKKINIAIGLIGGILIERLVGITKGAVIIIIIGATLLVVMDWR